MIYYIVVTLIAVINLGVGFSAAVYLGWGPRLRLASLRERLHHNSTAAPNRPLPESQPESAVRADSHADQRLQPAATATATDSSSDIAHTPTGSAVLSTAHGPDDGPGYASSLSPLDAISEQVELAEQRFQEILDHSALAAEPTAAWLAELQGAISRTRDSIAPLHTDDSLSGDNRQRVDVGLQHLRETLAAAQEQLAGEPRELVAARTVDFGGLAEQLATSCQEFRGTLTAVMFADQAA